MSGVFRFIHGYEYLIESDHVKGREFRSSFARYQYVYKPIFDQLFKQ